MTWAERWALIERFLPQLWDGTLVTLQLVGLAVVIGLFFAIPLGLARASRHWYIRALPYSYIFFFRGTPLLLQLFWSITASPSSKSCARVSSGPICASHTGAR